jgi:hypothetical protein
VGAIDVVTAETPPSRIPSRKAIVRMDRMLLKARAFKVIRDAARAE